MVIDQSNHICKITREKMAKSELTKIEDVKLFIKRIYDKYIIKNQPKTKQNFTSQLKLFACEQIANRYIEIIENKKRGIKSSVFYSPPSISDKFPSFENQAMCDDGSMVDEKLNSPSPTFFKIRTSPSESSDQSSMMIDCDENDGPTVFNTWAPMKKRKNPEDCQHQLKCWETKRKLFGESQDC